MVDDSKNSHKISIVDTNFGEVWSGLCDYLNMIVCAKFLLVQPTNELQSGVQVLVRLYLLLTTEIEWASATTSTIM